MIYYIIFKSLSLTFNDATAKLHNSIASFTRGSDEETGPALGLDGDSYC